MRVCLVLLVLLVARSAAAQPALRVADRVRLAEAFRLAASVADAVAFAGPAAPLAVLLVTPETEFLVGHPRPADGFAVVCAHDTLLGGPVWARPRRFAPTLLATFPATGGVPTVVVGTPEATGQTSTAWVVTLLHEHVHQRQAAQFGYYDAVEALGLTGGDTTGRWMLDYPFPYDDPAAGARFAAYRDALAGALAAAYGPGDDAALDTLARARARFEAALSPADRRYLAFQQWQEGAARDAEWRVAALAAERHDPLPAFLALPDALPYAAYADTLRHAQARELAAADLATGRRVAFYPTGAAEARLRDAVAPGWRRRYTADRFALPPVGR